MGRAPGPPCPVLLVILMASLRMSDVPGSGLKGGSITQVRLCRGWIISWFPSRNRRPPSVSPFLWRLFPG